MSLKASLEIFDIFSTFVIRQDFLWVYPIIGLCVFVNNTNAEYTHHMRVPEDEHSRIPTEVSVCLAFLLIGIPLVPRLLSPLPPVVGASPDSATPYILGYLVASVGV